MILSIVFSGLLLSVIAAVGAYVALRIDTRRYRKHISELEKTIEYQKSQLLEFHSRMVLLLADNAIMRDDLIRNDQVERSKTQNYVDLSSQRR